jgi:hypothetical protein
VLAAGRPVLISGARIICRDNVDGAIRMLSDFLSLSAHDIERMGRAARTCFLARFEVSISADAICAVVEEVKRSWPADRGGVLVR